MRKMLLKTMLWCLGLSAAGGAAAILLADQYYLRRVTEMGFTASFAAALMIPISLMVDRAKSRAAGLLGMCLIVVEFMLAQLLIWDVRGWGYRWGSDEIAETMAFLAITGGVAMCFLRIATKGAGRIAGRAGVLLCLVDFVSTMLAVWLPRSTGTWAQVRKLDDTSLALAGLGLLGTLCLVGVGTGDRRWWRWIGTAAAGAALAMALYHIWMGGPEGSEVFICITTLAGVVAHANLLSLVALPANQVWVRRATIAAAAATGGAYDAAVVWQKWAGVESDFLGRAAFAAGIVASSGTLAILVLGRLNRRVDYEGAAGGVLPAQITLLCPRCSKKQTLAVGDAACAACGLRIHTRIEEPRCAACEYPLTGLKGDRCPECGTLIRATGAGSGAGAEIS
jgi:hypothetical protein